MKKGLKTFIKVFIYILLFLGAYTAIMLVAYNYFYEYPKGILDVSEREENQRMYAIVHQEKIDNNTLIFFSRNKNGTGGTLHFGTIDSDLPKFLANFKSDITSSSYIPTETIGYITASSSDRSTYLFGATSNVNSVKCVVRFYDNEDDEPIKEYEMKIREQCFYYKGFDPKWANYNCTITLYDSDGYLVLQYKGTPFKEGEYTPLS